MSQEDAEKAEREQRLAFTSLHLFASLNPAPGDQRDSSVVLVPRGELSFTRLPRGPLVSLVSLLSTVPAEEEQGHWLS